MPSSTSLFLCLPLMLSLFGSKTKSPTEELYVAVYRGDVEAVKQALDKGADVNGGKPGRGDSGYKQNTPLAVAASSKNLEMMKLLIKSGADVNARNGELAGVTALEIVIAPSQEEKVSSKDDVRASARSRRIAAVRLLLDNGAEAGRTSRLGGCPLAVAAGVGPVEIVAMLLKSGAPVIGKGALDQPMVECARFRNPMAAEIMEKLLSNGGKVNTVFAPNGDSALHTAAANGNLPVARVLLEHGAKVETLDRFGATPLHRAATGNHEEMAKLLLAKGASRKAEDAEGRTPLMRAKSPEMKALLK
jgi:ankyrin repeat protein